MVQIATRVLETVQESGQDHVKVRMAFVSYRDYDKSAPKYDVPGIRVCNFTEDIQAIKTAVSSETASGGGDTPEVNICVLCQVYVCTHKTCKPQTCVCVGVHPCAFARQCLMNPNPHW